MIQNQLRGSSSFIIHWANRSDYATRGAGWEVFERLGFFATY